MKNILTIFSIVFLFFSCNTTEGTDFAADFENLSSFPKGPYVPVSSVWEIKYNTNIQLPGSVGDSTKMISKSYKDIIENDWADKHFSIYKDKNGENWIRFCVDTDNETGTSSGSDYLRTELSEKYLPEGSIGKTFEFEATFRINSKNLHGNASYIPGTTKRASDKVDFCQIHEEREEGFTKGKHNPPTLQIHLKNDDTIRLNYCPDRLRFRQDIGGDDERPGTKSVILYENYKNLEPIKIKFVYTGKNLKVWVNGVEKFDANENTKKVFGADTEYTMYENKNSYMKFGCYANTWKGFQCVYAKDITAKIYDTGTASENAENHYVLK